MSPIQPSLAILIIILGASPLLSAQGTQHNPPSGRVQLALNTDEAEAVLAILDKHNARAPITDVDWHRLFATEPYIRLKKRESAMHRDFTDDDFKTFVLSAELTVRAASLRQTLETWKQTDLTASARRVLAYLPEQGVIKAKVFPVIKPRPNSFVFDTQSDAAIFLYLNPEESAAKFENTVAHELHHIGYSSISELAESKQKDVSPDARPAVEWLGAFGEGFAMLAAAGGPDIDPHAASSAKERERWNHDLANFNNDLVAVQQFLLDIIDHKLVSQDKIRERASPFYGDAQGAWYTVGYKMAVTVEKRFGRKVLIDCMLDPRQLLARYNQAAEDLNRAGREKLALWPPTLLQKIGAQSPG